MMPCHIDAFCNSFSYICRAPIHACMSSIDRLLFGTHLTWDPARKWPSEAPSSPPRERKPPTAHLPSVATDKSDMHRWHKLQSIQIHDSPAMLVAASFITAIPESTPLSPSTAPTNPTTKGKTRHPEAATRVTESLRYLFCALTFRHHRQCASHFPCASYASFSSLSISRWWCAAPWTTAWCSATSLASSFLRLRHAARISLNSTRGGGASADSGREKGRGRLTFRSALLAVFLHTDVRIQVIQRPVRFIAPFVSTQIQPFDLIEFPTRTFLVDGPRRWIFIVVEEAHLMCSCVSEGRAVYAVSARARSMMKVDIGDARIPRAGDSVHAHSTVGKMLI